MYNFELIKLHFTQLDLKYLPLEDEDSELDDASTHRNSKSR